MENVGGKAFKRGFWQLCGDIFVILQPESGAMKAPEVTD